MSATINMKTMVALAFLWVVTAFAQSPANVVFELEQDLVAAPGSVADVKLFLSTAENLQVGTVQIDFSDGAILSLPNGTADVTISNKAAGSDTIVPTGSDTYIVGAASPNFGEVVWSADSANLQIATISFKVADDASAGDTIDITLKVSEADGVGAFKASDSSFVGDTQLVNTTLTVALPFNALDDSAQMNEDVPEPQEIDVLANDVDINSDPVLNATILAVGENAGLAPSHGVVSLEQGLVKYYPDRNYFGTDTFNYTAQDSGGNQDTGLVTVNILSVNDAPTLSNPAVDGGENPGPIVINEGVNAEFSITANDVDNANEDLTFQWSVDGAPAGGRPAELVNSNSFSFPLNTVVHPEINDAGHTVTVQVQDGQGGVNEYAWDITVGDVNQAPNQPQAVVVTPNDGNVTTIQDLTCTVTPNGDPDDDPDEGYTEPLRYTYTWYDGATRAVVRTESRTTELTDVLPAALTQKHRTYTCTITVEDIPYGGTTVDENSLATELSSNGETIVNTDPIAKDVSVFIRKGDAFPNSKEIPLDAADADGDDVLFVITSLPAKGTLSYDTPGRGTTTITTPPHTIPAGNSGLIYTVDNPDVEIVEPDTFEYAATDGDTPADRGEGQVATVSVKYMENQPPATPVVTIVDDPGKKTTDSITAQAGTVDDQDDIGGNEGITYQFTWKWSGGGDPIVREWVAEPGTTRTAGQTIQDILTVAETKRGTWTVEVVAKDAEGATSGPGTDTYDILNTAPSFAEQAAVTIDITNPTRDAQAVFASTLTANVEQADVDDPDVDDGLDTIKYLYEWKRSRDQGQTWTTIADSSNRISNGGQRTAELFIKGDQVKLVLIADDEFESDARVLSDPIESSVVVIGNTPPTAELIETATGEETPVEVNLSDGTSDPDENTGVDELSYSLTQPTHGDVAEVVGRAGSYVLYKADWDELAQDDQEVDSFTYTVTDGEAEGQAAVEVTVTGVNDAPVAESSSAYSEANVTVSRPRGTNYAEIDPLSGDDVDSDDDSTSLIYKIANFPMDGTLTDNAENPIAAGEQVTEGMQPLRYYPDPTFRGTDQFSFTATDSHGAESAPATVRITVGTPLWYPHIAWEHIPQQQEATRDVDYYKWYNIQIWDGLPNSDDASKVLAANVNGTALTPIEYFRAGSDGLLPGTYYWRYRTWVPRTNDYGDEWLPNDKRISQGGYEQLVVEDYGYAAAASDITVDEVVQDARDGGNRYKLSFLVPNARGYKLEIIGPSGFFKAVDKIFWPHRETGVIPLNQPEEVEVVLNNAGDYQWQVRGFNPKDEEDKNKTWTDGPDIAVGGVGDAVELTAPILISPDDGDVRFLTEGERTKQVTLKWKLVPGAVNYILYLASINQGPIVNRRPVGDVNECTAQLPTGSYVWMIIARDANGQHSAWSSSRTFDVAEHTVNRVIIESVSVKADDTDELQINLQADSAPVVSVDIHHHDSESSSWKVAEGVPVNGGSIITINGADFDKDEYVFIRGTSNTDVTSEFKLLVIK